MPAPFINATSREPGADPARGDALRRLVDLRGGETPALLWSFAYFFCLLCGYYILRPVREEMGIAGGVQNLQWVFTGTFVAMLAAVPLFGAAAARFPRRTLLPCVYSFFIANLLIFFGLLKGGAPLAYVAPAFFIWVSVFNLFVVSVFWSFMADLFTNEQARRLFGFIAAGGSAGAVAGSSLTAALATRIGLPNLLLMSALFLGGALLAIRRLRRWSERVPPPGGIPAGGPPIGGGVWSGVLLAVRSPYLLGICLYILLFTTLSTFLYFEQAHIVRNALPDPAQRTALFAAINLGVNVLTIAGQVLLTGRLVRKIGLPATLALLPGLLAAGFVGLGAWPALGMIVAVQVARSAGNFAVARPAREMLFTVVPREEKYKAKNFIDTVIYRGGDALSGWAFAGLTGVGLSLSGIAWLAVPLAAAWLATGLYLGRKQETLVPAAPVPATGRPRDIAQEA